MLRFRIGILIKKSRLPYALLGVLVIAGTLLAFPGAALAATASDSFQEANGPLSASWTPTADGGLAISSDQAVGQAISGNSGDLWTASTFGSDQFSQVTLTSMQLTGTQWLGAVVRGQAPNSGIGGYVGIYFWNNGSPELMLFLRDNGNWTQLGSTFSTSPLSAGTVLGLSVAGSALSLSLNGTADVTATDTTLTGGTPGIMTNGPARAAAWTGGDGAGASAGSYTVGGTVSGLESGGTVTIEDNGGDTLSVTANGSFTFPTALTSGTGYSVTVEANPSGQSCTVASGSGTVATSAVTSVAVTCASVTPASTSAADSFHEGNGSLSSNWTATADGGLSISGDQAVGQDINANSGDYWTASSFTSDQYSQVTLTSTQLTGTQWVGPAVRAQASTSGQSAYVGIYYWNNGSPDLTLFLRHNGNWTQLGSSYSVSALTAGTILGLQVAGTSLSMTVNGTVAIRATDSTLTAGAPGLMTNGPVHVASWAGGDVTYSVGGTVSGLLTGSLLSGALVLQDNGGDTLSVTANGSFTFPAVLIGGAAYNATVASSPAGQSCTVANGSGTIATAGVTSIAVACTPRTYTVGGTVSGLTGALTLKDNGGDTLSVTANGAFTFATPVAYGSAYAVTVSANPAGQSCTVTSGSGTIGAGNLTGVVVSCVNLAYSVGGTASGLAGTVALKDNGGDTLSVTANGSFTFATRLIDGAAYSVTVSANPSGQVCTVGNGSGTLGTANVTSVTITCLSGVPDTFNRANGSLGVGWTDMSGGGLAISAQAAAGTSSGAIGDIRSGEAYNGDQFSSVVLTSTLPTGGGWIGPSVRSQAGGASDYAGFYYANYGSPELMLFKRVSGSWTQLGSSYPISAPPPGTTLELAVAGTALAFYRNGVPVITATDSSLSGGAPGIMVTGTGAVIDWTGGNMNGTTPQATSTSTATYTIGGTVSGASGPVILQDNDTDTLTVSAGGSFTFATPLTPGAAYSVTVTDSPSGQACSVASGAGTAGSANVTNVAVTCAASPTTPSGASSASDNFQAANGSLSGNWTATSDGGLGISNNAAVGQGSGNSGDYWTADTFTSDQYSQVRLTSTQLNGTEWIGPSVRVQSSNSGQSAYVGLYFWNNGSPELMLFLRDDGNWTELGNAFTVSPLPVGTVLGLQAAGSTLSLTLSGTTKISVTDATLTGGAPGLMTNGPAQAAGWAGGSGASGSSGSGDPDPSTYSVGGTASGLTGTMSLTDNGADTISVAANGSFTFDTQVAAGAAYDATVNLNPSGQVCTVANGSGTMGSAAVTNIAVTCTATADIGSMTTTYESTDSGGVRTYDYTSPIINDGTAEPVRVLQPADPAAGVAHNFLIALPVEPGEANTFGDAMPVLEGLNAANQYNLTIIEPSFSIDPWYADSATDPQMQMETFMTDQLVPWIKANFATTGNEQVWLLGFSKSGLGAQDLILKHPSVYTLAASWDFPAGMTSYDQLGSSPATAYGTNANYLDNYAVTQQFVNQYAAPFTTHKRIWLGSYYYYDYNVNDYYAPELTAAGIPYDIEPPAQLAHRWDSGWVPSALAALYADSVGLGG